MRNAGLNKIDLSRYIRKDTRNRKDETSLNNRRLTYKLPEEIECLKDEVHMINKEIETVHTLDELRNTINLYGFNKKHFNIPESIVNFVQKNGQLATAKSFGEVFAVETVILNSVALGKIRSIRNFINWLKYDVKTRIYSRPRIHKLKDNKTRQSIGKPVNSKAIILHSILETLLNNESMRRKLIKTPLLPFSMAAVDIKLTTGNDDTVNPEGAESLDKFYVSINNIVSSLDVYVNALRIARALFREYEDPNVAYAAGMEVCKANLAKGTSLYDNILITYFTLQESEDKDVADTPDNTLTDVVTEDVADKPETTETNDVSDVESKEQ